MKMKTKPGTWRGVLPPIREDGYFEVWVSPNSTYVIHPMIEARVVAAVSGLLRVLRGPRISKAKDRAERRGQKLLANVRAEGGQVSVVPCDVAGCPNPARWYYPKLTLFGWNLCDTCKDTDPRGVDCLLLDPAPDEETK